MSFLNQIQSDWTLFLDRDGVINVEKEADYIRSAKELVVYEGVPEALHFFNACFARILVVTNQRGIGKCLMTEADLAGIHQALSEILAEHHAKIDAYYFAPQLDSNAEDRKPNTGMGLKAKRDFPAIEFSKSIMVGNNISDMLFGKRLGMFTVYVNTTSPRQEAHPDIDMICADLPDLANKLRAAQQKA